MWWMNDVMSEQCDGSKRQVDDQRHEMESVKSYALLEKPRSLFAHD